MRLEPVIHATAEGLARTRLLVDREPLASEFLAVLMLGAGITALFLPLRTGTVVAIGFTWLLLFAGVVHVLHSLSSRWLGRFAWHAAIGLAYVFSWFFLVPRPSLSLNMITLAVSFLFLFEGGARLIASLNLRPSHWQRWMVYDGVTALVTGGVILGSWPQSSAWAVGILIGIHLIISGLSRLLQPQPSVARLRP